MHLIPSEAEVLALLRQTGALRRGHFECLNGLHTSDYIEPALTMRFHAHAKTLSVGLSRLIRANPELRPLIPDMSIVAATPGGLPVAYGLCEALRARQVYWAEKEDPARPIRFRQFLEPWPGEPVLLVDDILRAGRLLSECKALLDARGARVLAVAVLLHQPTPRTVSFGDLPLFSLARLDTAYYADAGSCELCRRGVPLQFIGPHAEISSEALVAAMS